MQLQNVLKVLFPSQCVSCGALVEDAHALCGACWGQTPFIDGTVCDKCGLPLPGDDGDEAALCDDCIARPRPWDRGRATLLYEGRARKLVLSLKHGDRVDIARTAGRWMAPNAARLLPPGGVIVPVPLHWTRLLKRRFNQAALLASAIGRATGHEVIADGLVRHRRTGTQEKRSRDARTLNVAGSMIVHPGRIAAVEGRAVLVVDDVLTSGATFSEAAGALHVAGAASVSVLALARVAMGP